MKNMKKTLIAIFTIAILGSCNNSGKYKMYIIHTRVNNSFDNSSYTVNQKIILNTQTGEYYQETNKNIVVVDLINGKRTNISIKKE
jgi:hypothetical protein